MTLPVFKRFQGSSSSKLGKIIWKDLGCVLLVGTQIEPNQVVLFVPAVDQLFVGYKKW